MFSVGAVYAEGQYQSLYGMSLVDSVLADNHSLGGGGALHLEFAADFENLYDIQ